MILTPRYLIFLTFISMLSSCVSTRSSQDEASNITKQSAIYAQDPLTALGLGSTYLTPISSNTAKIFSHLEPYIGSLLMGNKTSHLILPGYFSNHTLSNTTDLTAIHAVFVFEKDKWNTLSSDPILFSPSTAGISIETPEISISETEVSYRLKLNKDQSFLAYINTEDFELKAESNIKNQSNDSEIAPILYTKQVTDIAPWLKSPNIKYTADTRTMSWKQPKELTSMIAENSIDTNRPSELSSTGFWIKDKDGMYTYLVENNSTIFNSQLKIITQETQSVDILVLRDLIKNTPSPTHISMFCPHNSSSSQEYVNTIQKIEPNVVDLSSCPQKATEPALVQLINDFKDSFGKEIAVLTNQKDMNNMKNVPINEQLAH